MRPQDRELARLLNRFVPVRITNMKGVDLNRFRFDYDLTFAVLMMDADGRTYARYGSQDYRLSADRMSVPGLKKAMREVLAMHKARTPPAEASKEGEPFTIGDYPAFAATQQAKGYCYHCHFANNARFKQLRLEGKFTKALLFQYPLPENVGITLDVDANTLVKSVAAGSPAEKAGIHAGDRVIRAGSAAIVTPADLQFVLNGIPEPGSVQLQVERGGKSQPPMTLELPAGWRRTDISWRPSQDGVAPQLGVWGRPLTEDEKRRLGIPGDRLGLQVNFFFPGEAWAKTRGDLRNGDILLGVNGKELPSMTMRQFHTHYRLNHSVGETLTLNVLRGGEKVEVRVPCLESPDE